MVQTAVLHSIGARNRPFAVLVCLLFVGAGLAILGAPASAAVSDGPTSCGPIIEDREGRYCITRGGLMKTFSSTTGEFLGYIHGGDPKGLLKDPFADDEDDADGAADVKGAPQLSGENYPDARTPHCIGPTSPDPEYYAQVIYARYADEPDTYTSKAPLIRDLVRQANGLLHDTAKELGKPLLYKVKCDGGEIDVQNAVLSGSCGSPDDCFNDMVSKLRGLGYDDTKVKYWVWTENNGCTCGGKGHVMPDDSLSVGNQNNGNAAIPMFAITFHGDTGVRVMMHENGHNMGAVQDYDKGQNGANNQGHCWDGSDIMCYPEPDEEQEYEEVCIGSNRWDCNSDTYFHPKPPAGSYLEDHWNVASSLNRYLVAGNAMPDAVDDAYVMDEDGSIPPLDVLANDEDEEDDDLYLHAVDTPSSGGTATIADDRIAYAPPQDFSGIDVFQYTVRDRLDPNNETVMFGKAVVKVEVRPINDAPTASDDDLTTPEDTPVDLVLVADDVEGGPLTWTFDGPLHGTLVGTPPEVTYEPDQDFADPDRFTFTVTDPDGLSATATVDIDVLPRPDPPNARDDFALAIDGVPDWPLDVLANDDAGPGKEAEVETIAILSVGTAGQTVEGASVEIDDAGTPDEGDDLVRYTPPTVWPGDAAPATDSFTYTIRDDGNPQKTATATVTVTIQPDDLAAFPDRYATTEDTALTVAANAGVLWNPSHAIPESTGKDPADHWPGKPNLDDVAVILATPPEHGTVSLGSDGAFTYTPVQDYHGADTFQYYLQTPGGDSNIATVELEVLSVNDRPVAQDIELELVEDAKVTLSLPGSDVEDDSAVPPRPLTFAVAVGPSHGRLEGTGQDLTYYPDGHYSGTDTFAYTVTDSDGGTGHGTVTLLIEGVNDPPQAIDDVYLMRPDRVNKRSAGDSPLHNDVDPDGDRLRMEIIEQPRHGSVSVADGGGFAYTPDKGFLGRDYFYYRAVDPDGAVSLRSTVRLDVSHNIAPDAHFEFATPAVEAGAPLQILDASQDLDGVILEYHWDFGDGTTSIERVVTHTYERPGIYDVRLRVVDDDEAEGVHARTVTVSGTFGAEFGGDLEAPLPVADAGPDLEVTSGTQVVLDGSGSHSPDGKPLLYRWTQVEGPDVSPFDMETAQPYFLAPGVQEPVSLVFGLRVFDGDQYAQQDNVTVVVAPLQATPDLVVGAGPDVSTLSGAGVELVATVSGAQGVHTARWTQVEGPAVDLVKTSARASFIAPYVTRNTTLVFEAVAVDESRMSRPDSVTVTVVPATAPKGFAAEGSGTARAFAAITAKDTPELSYIWDFGDGAVANGSQAEHAYAAPGTYNVRLTATNHLGYEQSWQQEVQVDQTRAMQFEDSQQPESRTGMWLVVGAAAFGIIAVLAGASVFLMRRTGPSLEEDAEADGQDGLEPLDDADW